MKQGITAFAITILYIYIFLIVLMFEKKSWQNDSLFRQTSGKKVLKGHTVHSNAAKLMLDETDRILNHYIAYIRAVLKAP